VAITKSLDDAHPVILTLEAGTIVTVVGQAQRSGLVDVLYKGETVAMFMRDLQDRADIIDVDLPLSSERLGDDSVQ
jgi:hypothetical protein